MVVSKKKTKHPEDECCSCVFCLCCLFSILAFTIFEFTDVYFMFPTIIFIVILMVVLSGIIQGVRKKQIGESYNNLNLDSYDKRAMYRREMGKLPVILGFFSPGYREWLKKNSDKKEPQKIQKGREAVVLERLPPAPAVTPRVRLETERKPPKTSRLELEKALYCPFCGNRVKEGSTTCELCGSPID